ncbi:MAG: hypothetical protein WC889_14885 [Myxococcota bacterium]|jgi:hypothetical protein
MRTFAAAFIFTALIIPACSTEKEPPPYDDWLKVTEKDGVITASTKLMTVTIDKNKGFFNVLDRVYGTEVRRIHAAYDGFTANGTPRLFTTLNRHATVNYYKTDYDDTVVFSIGAQTGTDLNHSTFLIFSPSKPGVLTIESSFWNLSSAPVKVSKFYPWRTAGAQGGALFIGDDPKNVRILQNGSDMHVDFFVNMLTGDQPLTPASLNALLGGYSSYSNGNAALYDVVSGATLVAGFVGMEKTWTIPVVATAGDIATAPKDGSRLGMTEFWGELRYPNPVEIPQSRTDPFNPYYTYVAGGTTVMIMGEKTPHDALERYADEIASFNGIKLPPVPLSGWDSWYTLGSMSEQYIRKNADALQNLFVPFGLASMQLDSGWEDTWGDWNAGTDFPLGLASDAEYIKQREILPELWIAPLSAYENSTFYKDHKGWFLKKDEYGGVLMPRTMQPFDLSIPGVMDRVVELGARVKGWGYRSIKMDFAYYTLLTIMPPDPFVTQTSLYREAIRKFREAAGDVFFINISMCYPNYGLVDAFRIGLDTFPCWSATNRDCANEGTEGISAQGLKPAMLNAARRYWLNGRVWWNHNDQVFVRGLDPEMHRAWYSIASLSGGMISMGDDVSVMTAEQAGNYRRILPLTGLSARPVDLFRTQYPEIWHLKETDPTDGDVIGLFNLGLNRDMTSNPFVERPDGTPVTHSVDLASLGMDPKTEYIAYEFWTGEVIDGIKETFTRELASRTGRVYRLIKKGTSVQYLATDRHLLMGPAIVKELNSTAASITGRVRTAPQYAQKLFFYVPNGIPAPGATVDGVTALVSELKDSILSVSFTGTDAADHTFTLSF